MQARVRWLPTPVNHLQHRRCLLTFSAGVFVSALEAAMAMSLLLVPTVERVVPIRPSSVRLGICADDATVLRTRPRGVAGVRPEARLAAEPRPAGARLDSRERILVHGQARHWAQRGRWARDTQERARMCVCVCGGFNMPSTARMCCKCMCCGTMPGPLCSSMAGSSAQWVYMAD